MTDVEKKAECQRICGESGKHDVHRIAPEMCPIQLDIWKNPPKRRVY